MGVMVGVDVGGTTISAGLVDAAGGILSVVQRATHAAGPGTAVDTLLTVVEEVVSGARDRGLSLEGIGVGLPGLVDADKGMMFSTSNCAPEFAQVSLAELLRAGTGLPAFVDNDVNVLALGEWTFGLGRGAAALVVLALGTGVGAGLIIGDRLVRGVGGAAGEFGHVPINFDGPRCACGGRGCLAVYVGGSQMAAEARRRVEREPGSRLLALASGDTAAITSELVFRTAREGDALARAIVEQACEALGAGLAVIVNGLNPELVVVTGGVADSLVSLEGEIRQRAGQYALAEALASTRIRIVGSDKRRTVLGGAALVLYELGRRRDPSETDARGRGGSEPCTSSDRG